MCNNIVKKENIVVKKENKIFKEIFPVKCIKNVEFKSDSKKMMI